MFQNAGASWTEMDNARDKEPNVITFPGKTDDDDPGKFS